LDSRESLKLLDEAANRAMHLDPNLAESHQAMAWEYLLGRWDFASADRELLQAISLDPRDAELYHLRAELLGILNRHTEAIEAESKAMELDPFERPWGLVVAYTTARQYDTAIADGELRLRDYPNDFTLLLVMTFAYLDKDMDKEAVDTWMRAKVAHGVPQHATMLRRLYQEGGMRAVLRWQLSLWDEDGKTDYVSPVIPAHFHARLGEGDTTLALLEEAYEQRAPDVLQIQNDPAYDFLHADPRYRALVQKIGLPPAY
jgi:tetratricopeptide (TPR) repeat protein